jgi:vacuolar protein sorting-associated protein 13A/C
VTIEAPLIFRNQFPRTLSFVFPRHSGLFSVPPNSKLGVFGIDISNSMFQIDISVEGGPLSTVSVKARSAKISRLPLIILENVTRTSIAVECYQKPKKPQMTFTFYAPTIIFNKSNLLLHCVNQTRTCMAEFSPREPGSDPRSDGVTYWSDPNFYQSKVKKDQPKLPVNIFVDDQILLCNTEPVDCSISGIDEVLLIPTGQSPELFIPLHYTMTSAEPYAHSTIVTITPHLSVINKFQRRFFLQPVGHEQEVIGDPIPLEAASKVQLKCCTATLAYLFNFEDSENFVILQLGAPVHSTFAASDSEFVEFLVEAIGCELVTTFGPAVLPQPVIIANRLNCDVAAAQTEQSFRQVIEPEITTFLAYRDPFGPTSFDVFVNNEKVEVNLVQVHRTIECPGGFCVEVVANPNHTKLIVISEQPIEKPKPREFEFYLFLPSINISFIDGDFRELALLAMDDIEFSYKSGEFVSVDFCMKSFQLDDTNPLALLHVVGAGYPVAEDDYLVSFKSTVFQSTPLFTTYEDVAFRLQPIVVFLDTAFISDFMHYVQSLLKPKGRTPLAPPKPAESSVLGQIPFSAENFVISEISLTMFIRSETSRPHVYPERLRYLRLIPDITNGQIVLPAFEFQHCTMTQAYVNSQIVQPLIRAGINQGVKLIFQTAIFAPSTGTRSSNFARRVERLMNGELQVIGQIGGSALLRGSESILGGVSKLLHFVSQDSGSQIARVNATATATAIDSAKAVGQGFLRGITGVITDPIKMGRERGAIGVILGIGKGLIGLVTKPVCGILDGGAGALAALRTLVNNEDDDVIPPMRIARAFPASEIRVLGEIEGGKPVEGDVRFIDAAQFAIAMSKPTRWDSRIEIFCLDAASKTWFAFTATKLFIIDNDVTIVRKWQLGDIREIRIVGSILTIKVGTHVEEFVVPDVIVARSVRDWIASRASALQIGRAREQSTCRGAH